MSTWVSIPGPPMCNKWSLGRFSRLINTYAIIQLHHTRRPYQQLFTAFYVRRGR